MGATIRSEANQGDEQLEVKHLYAVGKSVKPKAS